MPDVFTQHGAASWIELSTTDVEAAKSFYTKLLGWTTEDVTMDNMTYSIVKVDRVGLGGIMPKLPQMADAPS